MQPISNEYREYIARELPELSAGLVDVLETTAPEVSVRVNRRKCGASLPAIVEGGTPVPWCEEGFYLPERPDFTHDPALHQGCYYVQDASSMAVGEVVRQLLANLPEETKGRLRYLDACAAPGGKTTAAMAALPEGSLVVANEFDYRRAEILKENLLKWGAGDAVVSRGDTARYRRLPEWFHIVAADVPCSGEGMMRKDETARAQWTPRLVEECAARQREILDNLWETLMPGGYLIYSTCTFNRAENEEVMDYMIRTYDAEPVPLAMERFPGVELTETMLRFLPGRVRGEGLALGVLRKPGDLAEASAEFAAAMERQAARIAAKNGRPAKGSKDGRQGKGAPDGRAGKDAKYGKGAADGKGKKGGGAPDKLQGLPIPAAELASWLPSSPSWHLEMTSDGPVALPKRHLPELRSLSDALDTILLGLPMGTLKGRSLLPTHELALAYATPSSSESDSLPSSAEVSAPFPTAEVDLPTALTYLRRESLPGFDLPKGPVLLTHASLPLGFVNNLGNRSNNLYPAPWRILK